MILMSHIKVNPKSYCAWFISACSSPPMTQNMKVKCVHMISCWLLYLWLSMYLTSTFLNAAFVSHQREIIQMCNAAACCWQCSLPSWQALISMHLIWEWYCLASQRSTEREIFPFSECVNSSNRFSSHIWAL